MPTNARARARARASTSTRTRTHTHMHTRTCMRTRTRMRTSASARVCTRRQVLSSVLQQLVARDDAVRLTASIRGSTPQQPDCRGALLPVGTLFCAVYF